MGIAVCSHDLYDAVSDIYYGYIEGTASKVVYHYLLFLFILKSVSKGCCRRLVYDTLYVKSCYLARILCSLTLSVVEVCRYSYDCLAYLLSKIALGVSLKLLEYHCRYLLRSV